MKALNRTHAVRAFCSISVFGADNALRRLSGFLNPVRTYFLISVGQNYGTTFFLSVNPKIHPYLNTFSGANKPPLSQRDPPTSFLLSQSGKLERVNVPVVIILLIEFLKNEAVMCTHK